MTCNEDGEEGRAGSHRAWEVKVRNLDLTPDSVQWRTSKGEGQFDLHFIKITQLKYGAWIGKRQMSKWKILSAAITTIQEKSDDGLK